jgi:MFS family permease
MRQLTQRLISPDLPGQFKLMVAGSLLVSTGFTMSFPFLTLYLNTQLGIPLDKVGLLFMFHAAAGLFAQMAAGPLADRIGRKPVMMVGLFATGLFALGYTQAQTYEQFLLLAFLNGFFGSVYYPASSAMVIDLVGPERRAEAFGLSRVAVNLGWVIGPSLGGLMATRSYIVLFVATAVAEFAYGLVLAFFARETLPPRRQVGWDSGLGGGYGKILCDRLFLVFIGASVLTTVVAMQLTTTMPVFLKQQGIQESGYGLLMALNAGLVVLFQIPTTRLIGQRDRVWMLILGALLYAIGFGTMAWWDILPLFALSIVIVTVGEMVIVPVSSALVADLAPPEARARYTSLFGLTWTIGMGIGPAAGGLVMERLGPDWLWHACLATGMLSALAFLPLRGMVRARGVLRSEPAAQHELARETAGTPVA